MDTARHVLIVGGGFGGLAAAQGLRHAPVRVTVVDRRNYHLFQPLLYQVATAGLAPSDIAEPIRSVLCRQANATVRLAEVVDIDLDSRRVCTIDVSLSKTTVGEPQERVWIPYDYLVVAAGASHSYFGNDTWSDFAPGLKTIPDALEIRRKILTAFERAEWESDPGARAALLTFVVVGGGPTGVELAGAIAEVAFSTLKKDFRRFDTREARVILVEASAHILGSYPERLRGSAGAQLERLGVEVRTNTRVTDIRAESVRLAPGEVWLPTSTVLWAAGIAASPLTHALSTSRDRSDRVEVTKDCSLPSHPNVFVIGDMCRFTHQTGSPLPGVAPVASSQGKHAASCIRDDLRGRKRSAYRYLDKGSMATIGRSKAIVHAGRLMLSGWPAWLAWVFVHLWFLVTYRNRTLVFLKWAWAWVTFERASRLIWQSEIDPIGPQSEDDA